MAVRGVFALQEELEKAKESLKGVDDSIKKLTGRDPAEGRGMVSRRGRDDGRGSTGRAGRLFGIARRGIIEDSGPVANRRQSGGSAFGRLGPRVAASRLRPQAGLDSGDEEDLPRKPTLQSSVVATPKETVTRQEVIEEQNKDGRGKQRNRRMFGLLLGTLQSFKDEEKLKVDKEKQRKAIEEKLDEKAREEKEELKKERMLLYNERRAKQAKLRKLEQKMELVDIHEEWERQTQHLMHFIRTKAKPPIYYLPREHNSSSEKRMTETSKMLEEIIEDRRKQLEEEIEELTKEESGKGKNEEYNTVDMELSQKEERPEEGEAESASTMKDRHDSDGDVEDTDHRVVTMHTDDNKENGMGEGVSQDRKRESHRGESRRGEGDSDGSHRDEGDTDEHVVQQKRADEADKEVDMKEGGDKEGGDRQKHRESRRERKRSRKDSRRSTDGDQERMESGERDGGHHHRKRDREDSEERQRERNRREHKKPRQESQRSRSRSASDTEGGRHGGEVASDEKPQMEKTPEQGMAEADSSEMMTEADQPAVEEQRTQEGPQYATDVRRVVSSPMQED